MSRVKTILRVGGMIIVAIGIMCLPVAHATPKRDTSVFYNLADLDAFVRIGFSMIGVGLAALAISRAIPADHDR
jgi:hypothetical protein